MLVHRYGPVSQTLRSVLVCHLSVCQHTRQQPRGGKEGEGGEEEEDELENKRRGGGGEDEDEEREEE
ncbi:hypothetical protein BHM03_00058515 [Ensete ventricosum]|nr:hypothetical protein BHM03_00058515 [Ensete ventricosum]